MKILPHCLVPTGTKLLVTERVKSKSIPPGSTCFMATLDKYSPEFPNSVLCKVIVTRSGKRGKERACFWNIATAVFPIEIERRQEEIVPLPGIPSLELSTTSFEQQVSVLDFTPVDFIGWSWSRLCNLLNISQKAMDHGKISPSVIARMSSYPPDPFGGMLGNDGLQYAIDYFLSTKRRINTVHEIRKWECLITQMLLERKVEMYDLLLRALCYLLWTNRRLPEKLYDEELLQESYSYYREMRYKAYYSLSRHVKSKQDLAAPAQNVPGIKNVNYFVQDINNLIAGLNANENQVNFDGLVFNKGKELPPHHTWSLFDSKGF